MLNPESADRIPNDTNSIEILKLHECMFQSSKIMAAHLYPGGWEIESESETVKSKGMEDGDFSGDALYDAGVIGGGRRECLGPANVSKLEPDEEENFRREARRAAMDRPIAQFEFTKSMEDMLKTFPLILGEENKIEEEDEVPRQKKTGRKRQVSPGKSCGKPPTWS